MPGPRQIGVKILRPFMTRFTVNGGKIKDPVGTNGANLFRQRSPDIGLNKLHPGR